MKIIYEPALHFKTVIVTASIMLYIKIFLRLLYYADLHLLVFQICLLKLTILLICQ